MKNNTKALIPTITLALALVAWNGAQADAAQFVGIDNRGHTAIIVGMSDRDSDEIGASADDRAIAIGSLAKADVYDSVAIGNGAWTKEMGGVAMGSGAVAENNLGVAIGYNAAATNDDDVAIGSHSTTREVTQVRGMTIGGQYYRFTAGTEVAGAVSIGVEYDWLGTTYTRQLQYVAPGRIAPDSTDGVNGSQLYAVTQAVDYNSGRIDSLSGRVDKVGAGAAALAALHPLDYDADNKLSFASGVGNYAGASAMAVGAFYRPNDDCMISMAGSMGGGENMVNLGVSFAIGSGTSPYKNKQAMAQTIEDLRSENLQLKDKMTQQDARIAKQDEIIAKLIARVDALSQDK